MAEQLPEGTDTIIADGGQDRPVIEAGSGSTLGKTEAGVDNAETPTPSGKGAWFDRIDDLKSQGFDSARSYAVSGKDMATNALDELIRTVADTAGQIDAKVGTGYGDYVRRAADGLGSFNDTLKGKDVDQLFAEARSMVAKAPAVAVGTAAALGFVIARLARAGIPEEAPTSPRTEG